MVQNMQRNSANEIGGQATRETVLKRPKAQLETIKVIACPVCRAVYIPFLGKGIQRPVALLETAFLSVCRFCFRCQRPACPQCWNREHNLCAACSQEVQVPFYVPLPSFEGLVFSPLLSMHRESVADVSFICRRNGRFASPELVSSETTFPTCLPVEKDKVALNEAYPTWLQEVMGRKAGEQFSEALPLATGGLRISEAVQTENSVDSPSTNSLEPIQIVQADKVVVREESTSQEELKDEKLSFIERIENVLIILVSIILVALILMIVLAVSSADLNALFLRLFHVDIRAEIAYLLKLI